MNKSDLKDGMIIKARNGEELYLLHGKLLKKDVNIYITVAKLYDYDYHLINDEDMNEYDIMKVFDAQNNLLWERKEVDWNKIPFGTRVRCWNNEYESYEGRLLKYSPDRDYPFMLYYINNDVSSFKYCELIEDIEQISYSDMRKERQEQCNKYEIDCMGCKYRTKECDEWFDDNFIITRK